LKLTKLANWFSDENPEKNKLQEQAPQQPDAKWEKIQSTIEKLNQDLQASHKQIAQAQAQLQINQGFQIELGETQLKLQEAEAQLQRYKQELFAQQKQLSSLQTEYQTSQQTLAQMAEQKNWLGQLKTPIQVASIQKTLPKQDFETLWGFGILSPTIDTIVTTGAIFVRGWVLGKKSQSKIVRVLYQGETLLETSVDLRRPAIAQQYPDILPAGQSGFEFSLGVMGITAATTINIEASLQDDTTVSLCNILLKQTIESNDT
jgi:prefoldin subunit 5